MTEPTMQATGPASELDLGIAPLTVDNVKKLRVHIRRMKNSLPVVGPGRYNSMVFTSLEKAAMWLGKLLGTLDDAPPYPYDGKTVQPIADDTTETYASNNPMWDSLRGSQKITNCRNLLAQWVKQIVKWVADQETIVADEERFKKIYHRTMALNQVYCYLQDSAMDLGMELGQQLKAEQFQTRGEQENLEDNKPSNNFNTASLS